MTKRLPPSPVSLNLISVYPVCLSAPVSLFFFFLFIFYFIFFIF
ncbi:Protein of unknown function [Mycobacterium canettii CIPT 140070017]|nr:Protein of unknown function [Mycobacterium canettii CIPT 140070017]